MSTHTETRTQAWKRRASLTGSVDFTMMYVAHDAFNRDLGRLVAAAEAGAGLSPAAIATWRSFSKQLHTHHRAEDASLWPRLYRAVSDPDEIEVLREMEAEHGSLDPRLEQIDAAIDAGDATTLRAELEALAEGLSQHMIHEEQAALPLLERRTGAAGWESFTREIRAQQGGLKGAAEYLPWVLDDATPETTAKVLHLLPPPARFLYRRLWEPKYRGSARLA
ncbi:MAG: hemerythrin domain-containing protein [Nocardioides sp.]